MKKKVTGAKPSNATLMIDVPVARSTRVCRIVRFDPKNALKTKIVGRQMTDVSMNKTGSFTADEIACIKLCWLPMMTP